MARATATIASGLSVGAGSVSGVVRFIADQRDLAAFTAGEIFMADVTLPEWRSVMAKAGAIITNRGGEASDAALAARGLGILAVIDTVDGASRVWTGARVTVAGDADGRGRVFATPPACPSARS